MWNQEIFPSQTIERSWLLNKSNHKGSVNMWLMPMSYIGKGEALK